MYKIAQIIQLESVKSGASSLFYIDAIVYVNLNENKWR